MISIDTKLKFKELLQYCGEEEIYIEKLRQMLTSLREFEPYTAFKRIDRHQSGFVDAKSIC